MLLIQVQGLKLRVLLSLIDFSEFVWIGFEDMDVSIRIGDGFPSEFLQVAVISIERLLNRVEVSAEERSVFGVGDDDPLMSSISID